MQCVTERRALGYGTTLNHSPTGAATATAATATLKEHPTLGEANGISQEIAPMSTRMVISGLFREPMM